MRLLTFLFDLIFPVRRDEEVVRALDEAGVLALLSPTPIEVSECAGVALMPYRRKEVGALIREAKFKSNGTAYTLLAAALQEFLTDYLSDRYAYEPRTTVLVPIPLSKKRFRERGYNQVEEVLKRMTLDVERAPHLLKRTRDTKTQTQLSKGARAENLAGAFVANEADEAVLYIIVDDVFTTGATLSDAVRALKEAGAKHLLPVALSH